MTLPGIFFPIGADLSSPAASWDLTHRRAHHIWLIPGLARSEGQAGAEFSPSPKTPPVFAKTSVYLHSDRMYLELHACLYVKEKNI